MLIMQKKKIMTMMKIIMNKLFDYTFDSFVLHPIAYI
jgi:hypothetical protein